MSQATNWQQDLIADTEQDVLQWLIDQPEAAVSECAEYINEHLDNLALMFEEKELAEAINCFRAELSSHPETLRDKTTLEQQFGRLRTSASAASNDLDSEQLNTEDADSAFDLSLDGELNADMALEDDNDFSHMENDFAEIDSEMADLDSMSLDDQEVLASVENSDMREADKVLDIDASIDNEQLLEDIDELSHEGFDFSESALDEEQLAIIDAEMTVDNPDQHSLSEPSKLMTPETEKASASDYNVPEAILDLEDFGLLLEAWQRVSASDNWISTIQPIIVALESWGEINGMKGIVKMSKWLSYNLVSFDRSALADFHDVVQELGDKLFWLCQETEDHNSCFELIELAEDPLWPAPLSEEDSLAVFGLFMPQDEVVDSSEAREWTESDVSLSVADDVSPQVLECFLQDSPQQLEELSAEISQLFAGFDKEIVHAAQRVSHTLKGAANLVGIKAIANISHQMEDLFETAANNDCPLSAEQMDWLQISVDCLANCMDHLLGQGEAPTAEDLLPQLYPPGLHGVNEPSFSADMAVDTSDSTDDVSAFEAAEYKTASAQTTDEIEDKIAKAQPVAATKPVPVAAEVSQEKIAVEKGDYDHLLSIAEEMSIALVQTRDLQGRLRNLVQDSLRQDDLLQARRFDLESLVDSRSQAGGLAAAATGPVSDMDPLEMDRYDELYTSTHRFIETVMDSRAYSRQLNEEFTNLENLIQVQQRHNVGLQNRLLSARQVPVSYISQRLQRCVRETCRATGKNAQLVMEGENLRVDKELLDALAWSLMHLLRNAIDHGIETPEQRLADNKPEVGTVTLSFLTDGLKLMVRCRDDGAGLDLGRIHSKALDRGMIAASDEKLTHEQIEAIVFQSGFSTRDTASQVSGRGIGLDAVRDRLTGLGGEIRLRKQETKSCEFYLELPLKRLTQHLLLVMSGERRYAMPTSAIKQTLPRHTGAIRMVAGKPFLEWEKVLYPYYDLDAVLNNYGTEAAAGENEHPVLLVKIQQGMAAVAVDQLVGAQSLVRRPLGDYVGKLKGIEGITLLGDGTPVALLEPRSLLEKASPRLGNLAQPSQQKKASVVHVLVVDDSLSVRNALSELLSDMGFTVTTANDGMDAIEKVQHQVPDLALVDMEMPRMNGLDFTRWIRNESQVPQLPVVMLTSRTQGKHRKLAEEAGVSRYQTKPYSDVELLDCINGALLREVS